MTDNQNWLAEYVQTGSDAAFRELVAHYVDLVYSTALRLVGGNAHRAEDVAQIVFVRLARVARALPKDVKLGGWLHRDTCFTASTLMRGERRRQARERQAVAMNALQNISKADYSLVAPVLDEAINELGEEDRTAILLRFFEQNDFRSVGDALGSNEDAARMRVKRALEKLEGLLKRRGITTAATSLGVVLSANAVQAAPVGLAVTISPVALAGTAATTSTIIATTTKAIAMTTLQKTLVTAAVAVLAGAGIYEAVQNNQLNKQVQTLQKQQLPLEEQISQLRSDWNNTTNRLAALQEDNERLNRNTRELLRLRGENTRLQNSSSERAALQNENLELRRRVSYLEGFWRNVTNSPQFKMAYVERAGWSDRGNSDPLDVLLSAANAISGGDYNRLQELLIEDTNRISNRNLFTKKYWDDVKGIQIVSVDYVNDGSGEQKGIVQTVMQKQMPTDGNPESVPALEDLRRTSQSILRWLLVKREDGWRLTGAN
jgi:RNA polymerase sigma factor (sigma-70 family)